MPTMGIKDSSLSLKEAFDDTGEESKLVDLLVGILKSELLNAVILDFTTLIVDFKYFSIGLMKSLH